MDGPTETPETPGPASTEHPVTVLLVDDQKLIAEAVRRMIKDEPDIVFHYVSDPIQAIPTACEVTPTVILQDLNMPEIDGLDLVRYFRANAKTREVPLIVLSSEEEPVVKAKAFAMGANDYMVKLPDKLEVLARIRYHSRGYIALQERNEAYQKLARELAEAADYVISLLPERQAEPQTDWRFIPSAELGGDSFGYHWIDDDHFAIYLLDVCGHGVGAALLSVSAMNVLRSQTLPDTDFCHPGQVLQGLNETFQMEDQHNMYFTMWYGVWSRASGELAYASGGHPPAVLLTGPSLEASTTKELATPGMVIGGMPGLEFPAETCTLDKFNSLFVFSDGVYEVKKKEDGKVWTLEQWVELLDKFTHGPPDDLDWVVDQVRAIQGTEQFEDDFSLLQVVL